MFTPTPRQAGWSGLVGGLLWALTPLRTPVFGAGGTADEGETFFRLYNVAIIVIAVLLTVALLGLRDLSRSGRRSAAVGWWTILAGHVLLVAGSLPAVLLGDAAATFVKFGQDLGFFGAMIAALGAFVVGISAVRQRRLPRLAFWLFLLTLPLGFVAIAFLTALDTPEDYLGLPLTILYGGAWIVLGWCWVRASDGVPAPVPSTTPE